MVSRRRGRLAAIVVVAAIVVAAFVARELRAGDDAPGRIGLNTHLQAAGDRVRPQLAEMRAGGVRWIREDFLWSRIEPQPGRFDWSTSDALMAAAAAEGVDVLGILDYSAPWASSTGEEHAPPRDPRPYAAFARAVVDRYGDGGAFWDGDGPERPLAALELWNEPWGHFFWKPDPDPVAYARLARPAAEAIRDADRGVDILVSADLLQVRTDGSEQPWFASLLKADRKLPELVDAWSVHPYPQPRNAAPDAPGDPRFSVSRVTETERIAAAADATRPIWITELGWSTAPESGDGVSEEQQAEYVADTLDRALGPWREFVARTFVYSWDRSSGTPGDVEGNYGLRRADGSLKPAWRAIAERAGTGDG